MESPFKNEKFVKRARETQDPIGYNEDLSDFGKKMNGLLRASTPASGKRPWEKDVRTTKKK